MGKNGLLCSNARRKMTGNMRHKIQQSNEGRLQERRDRLQNALEQRRQAEVAEASTSTQTFGPQEDAEKKQFEALERKKEIKVIQRLKHKYLWKKMSTEMRLRLL